MIFARQENPVFKISIKNQGYLTETTGAIFIRNLFSIIIMSCERIVTFNRVDFDCLCKTGNFGKKIVRRTVWDNHKSVIEDVCDRINNLLAKLVISGESERDA